MGDLLPGILNGKVVHHNVSQLAGGVLNGFAMFPKELSLIAVCMDEMARQFVLMMLIIDHLAAVHQCCDACYEILGVLSWPSHNILEFSKVHMGVDIMCHSLLDLVEEGRNFCLGHFLFLLTASRHPLCIHLQGFGSEGCKDISEVVLAVWWDAVEEEPVLQGMLKYGEGVVGILGSQSLVGRMMDAVLAVNALAMVSAVAWADWVMSCCGVGSEAMFQVLDSLIMVRSGKMGEYTKVLISWEPSVQFTSNLDRM